MNNEMLTIVDELNQPIYEAHRNLAIKDALWRRAAGGIVYDPFLAKILCHKRSKTKDERPDFWVATFGGKVGANESVFHAASRELFEEFGIIQKDIFCIFFGLEKSIKRKQFEYIFIILVDSTKIQINPDINEVSETHWIDSSKCIKRLKSSSHWYAYGYEANAIRLLRKARKPYKEKKRIPIKHQDH